MTTRSRCSFGFYNPTTRRRWGVCGCGVFPDAPCAESPALVACGVDDAGRLEIGRDFAYRYREAGGSLLWYPTRGGHELNDRAALGAWRPDGPTHVGPDVGRGARPARPPGLTLGSSDTTRTGRAAEDVGPYHPSCPDAARRAMYPRRARSDAPLAKGG